MRALIVSLLALTVTACASVQRLDAAGDVHALLISIRDNDSAAFDARVDRGALKREIEARLTQEVGQRQMDPGAKALAMLLAQPLAELAGETLVQPRVFRAVAESYGYGPATPIPNSVVIAGSLKALDDGRVCATKKKDGPCVLTFTREEGVWKLSGFEGELSMLRLKG